MIPGAVVEGGCLCGAVRYRVDGGLRETTHCHCTMCRRTSGAPLVTWTVCDPSDFSWTAGRPARFASSPGCERTFCATCGSKLTFTDAKRPGDIDIATGSLDRPGIAVPRSQIFGASRLPWIDIDPHVPFRTGDGPDIQTPATAEPGGILTGGCFCGAVRFEVAGRPLRSSICHCGICRRTTGGPFGVGGVWLRESVSRWGETTAYASSDRAWRHFCPSCGATVFFEDLGDPAVWEVMPSLLDTPATLVPECHLFAADAVPGLVMGDALPRWPGPCGSGAPDPALLHPGSEKDKTNL
ncbi:GFA family protein [Thalassobaculum sp.]|uniref:GFA family protein n=1 Tax=Thalassobaculum sp. TaxID=2022740 RepID=UPI003B5B05AD